MESGMRLIVAGCSQTYGHCLPDCYVQDAIVPQPSKMSFAQLIGSFIGADVHNLSWPGGSTRNMWYELMNFDYQPDDKVICVWTFSDRDLIVQRDKKKHVGVWPSVDELNKAYQRFTALSASNEDLELRTFEHIDHVHRVVSPQVSTILHYKVSKVLYENLPKWASFKFTNALDFIVPHEEIDYAIDGKHYGIESHKRIARQMIQDLTIDSN
jgi:hypothetical protein